MEKKFLASDLKPGRFFSDNENRVTYLQLNTDSTFAYYAQAQDQNYYLAAGNYHERKNFLFLDWDSLLTLRVIDNPVLYNQYKVDHPRFLALLDTMYCFNKKRDVLKIKNMYDRVEIFFTSKDVFTHGLMIDSLQDFPWPFKVGEKKMVLYKKFGKNITFPADSVWGFRVYAPGMANNVYRCTKEYLPLAIAYYGDFVLYYSPTGHVIPVTHKPLRNYYSSKTLDSEVFPYMKWATPEDVQRKVNK